MVCKYIRRGKPTAAWPCHSRHLPLRRQPQCVQKTLNHTSTCINASILHHPYKELLFISDNQDSPKRRHPIIASDLSKGLHSHPPPCLGNSGKGSPSYQKTERHPRRWSSNTQILDSLTSDAGCARRPHCPACAPITAASSSSQTSLNCIRYLFVLD